MNTVADVGERGRMLDGQKGLRLGAGGFVRTGRTDVRVVAGQRRDRLATPAAVGRWLPPTRSATDRRASFRHPAARHVLVAGGATLRVRRSPSVVVTPAGVGDHDAQRGSQETQSHSPRVSELMSHVKPSGPAPPDDLAHSPDVWEN